MTVFQKKTLFVVALLALLGLAGCHSTEDNDYDYPDSAPQQPPTDAPTK